MKSASIFAAAVLWAGTACMAFTDLTFFAVSDVHFGQSSVVKDSNRAAMPGFLNGLAGTNYPATLGGGPVAAPRGILVPGDLINTVDSALWRQYVADYGVNGEGRVKYPVYDGLGNHDYYGNGSIVVDALRARNRKRAGLTASDATNLHYSWDWDGVHFVMLNLYSGTVASNYDPFASYAFLAKDLADNVGSSGRPVLVMQHFPLPDTGWWPQSEADKSIALLKKYNCLGILHGHSHSKKFYKFQNVDIYDDGTVMNGDILVFHLKDGKLTVANRVGKAWGSLVLQKDVSMGTTGLRPGGPGGAAIGKDFTFLVDGVGRIYGGNRRVDRVDVFSLSGRHVRSMAVESGVLAWDRRDDKGVPVRPGMYVVRMHADGADIDAKVLLR
ncbi:MAG: metallophosphoesterase [Fibrobacteres bacterium]|nr:metallophosphoesterase [Fibrobacterota bacterium]